MSNIFAPYARANGGTVPMNTGSGVPSPATKNQHLLVDPDGKIYASQDPIDHYGAGLPFDANGRLVTDQVGSPAYTDQGMVFSSGGALYVQQSPPENIDYFDQGVGFRNGGMAADFSTAATEGFFDSNGEQFFDSNNQAFLVQE